VKMGVYVDVPQKKKKRGKKEGGGLERSHYAQQSVIFLSTIKKRAGMQEFGRQERKPTRTE